MSTSFFFGGTLCSSTDADTSTSKPSAMAWSTTLSTMLRVEGAPDSLNMCLPISMVVTKAATSIARNKFDLQILNARFREIENAQNTLVVQSVIGRQKEHPLFGRPVSQDRCHSRGQFGRRNLLISQSHATIRGKSLPSGGAHDMAGRGLNAQNQPRFLGLRGTRGGSRDIDVVAVHEQGNDDHEDNQQYEHHVHERRDVNLRLQIGAGIACVEMHDVTPPGPQRAWRSTPPRGSRTARSPPWPAGLRGS